MNKIKEIYIGGLYVTKNKSKHQHEMGGRRVWNMNPTQKVIPNKKRYNRKRDKKEMELP